jgi:hypothetical protein
MIPTFANGQPAAATYHRNGDGTYRALGVAVLTVTLAGITRITVFADSPGLVAHIPLPPTQGADKSCDRRPGMTECFALSCAAKGRPADLIPIGRAGLAKCH